MRTNLLSIAIVNYNNRKELEKCLQSINKTKGSLELEIYVYDNNSTDGSQEMIRTSYPSVCLIRSSRNQGLTPGLNIIFKKASGHHILILDSDTELNTNALKNLSTFLLNRNDVGIVGARVFSEDGSIQETARRFPNFLSGLFGRRALMTRLFPNNRISRRFTCMENVNSTEPFEVDYVSTACMMMKREVLEKTGDMDEDFFVYWTDVDWCRRVKNDGFKIFCVPSAKIIHYERYKPWIKKSPKMIIDFNRGAYLYYRKHNIRSRFSPLNLFSAAMLIFRTGLHLFLNYFKRKEKKAFT